MDPCPGNRSGSPSGWRHPRRRPVAPRGSAHGPAVGDRGRSPGHNAQHRTRCRARPYRRPASEARADSAARPSVCRRTWPRFSAEARLHKGAGRPIQRATAGTQHLMHQPRHGQAGHARAPRPGLAADRLRGWYPHAHHPIRHALRLAFIGVADRPNAEQRGDVQGAPGGHSTHSPGGCRVGGAGPGRALAGGAGEARRGRRALLRARSAPRSSPAGGRCEPARPGAFRR